MSSKFSGDVGFIGLGTMGLPMALNLARRLTGLADTCAVVVYDSRPESVQDAAAQPAVRAATSPREVAQQCRIVFTCLPDDAACEQVYRGPDGLLADAQPGLTTCDCSTVSPDWSAGLAKEAAQAGHAHLTAPMLGSRAQAESGDIFFILGGDVAASEGVTALLSLMGRMHMHVGTAEDANKIKLLHNALGAVNYAAVAEALALCTVQGVDLKTFYEVVRNGGGMAFGNYFDRKVPTIIAGDYTPRFKLRLAHKDSHLAQQMVSGLGVDAPIMDHARALLEEALEDGHGESDASAVTHVLEKRIGRPIRGS